ncbi:large-conductance mechanosensitive channel protein MscL [Maribacter sp. M208]|uniref:large-conductance mechanosensitive channel protein MscL n=1 Tax=Maribacter huludaoensis TaxID=3030010 RepID=UPI0023EA97EF|nr:large-conductance mechanosensitive channel protein MscL [Maribacter huludaoensis]MDF4223196.1 large-conductance mechanosensitive channel protein MscL [Maribacter huludaoensis]
MKKFFEEFKNFAIKGNMIDLAVGIIIGTAFNKVVSTIVSAIIMPPLSLLTDDVNLSNKKWVLREAAESVEEVAIGYGELIESLIDFGIIAFTIFVMVKFINRFKAKSDDPTNKEVETPKNIVLLSSMEKLLQEQNALLKNKK